MTTTAAQTARRRRDWSAHDRSIPFRQPRLVKSQRTAAEPAGEQDVERPLRGRRISWAALWHERPDRRPATA
jgi:hypothetical protein